MADSQKLTQLLADLQAAEPAVRQRAAQALSDYREIEVIEALISTLQDEDDAVREAAARSLIMIADSRTGALLNEEERKSEAFLLRLANWAQVDHPDITTLEDLTNAIIRISYNGSFVEEPTFEHLLRELFDEEWMVRMNAAELLGDLGTVEIIEPLVAIFDDDEWLVQITAAFSLGRITDPMAVEPLIDLLYVEEIPNDLCWVVHTNIAQALGNIGDLRAFDPLLQLLQSSDDRIRKAAAQALAELGDKRAVEPLLPLLHDKSAKVRCAAADALGILGDSQVVAALIELLNDTDQDLLEDGDNRVCDYAADALENIGTPEALAAVKSWRGQR